MSNLLTLTGIASIEYAMLRKKTYKIIQFIDKLNYIIYNDTQPAIV